LPSVGRICYAQFPVAPGYVTLRLHAAAESGSCEYQGTVSGVSSHQPVNLAGESRSDQIEEGVDSLLVLSTPQGGALHENHGPGANGSQVRCDGSPADRRCSNCQRYFIECVFKPVSSQQTTHRLGLSSLGEHGESGRLFGPSITHEPPRELPAPPTTSLESPDTLAPIFYPRLPTRSVHLPSIWQILGSHTPPEVSLLSRSDGSVESAPTSWLRSFKITQEVDFSHQGIDFGQT
jgi:hypothetical protein